MLKRYFNIITEFQEFIKENNDMKINKVNDALNYDNFKYDYIKEEKERKAEEERKRKEEEERRREKRRRKRRSDDEYATSSGQDSVNKWYRYPFPDHNDTTPSFVLNLERQNFKCFTSGKSGDVFSFLMEMENISFMDSLKRLSKRANVELKIDYNDDSNKSNYNESDKIYIDEVLFYHETLKKDIGKFGRDYIEKRKLNDETVLKFAICAW